MCRNYDEIIVGHTGKLGMCLFTLHPCVPCCKVQEGRANAPPLPHKLRWKEQVHVYTPHRILLWGKGGGGRG